MEDSRERASRGRFGFCRLRSNDGRPVAPNSLWLIGSGTDAYPLGTDAYPRARTRTRPASHDSYLVDPASSHMLVSKIKPCMSKYKLLHSETANGSLDQLWFLRSYNPTWITVVILELIHESTLRLSGKSVFITTKPIGLRVVQLVTLNNFVLIAWPRAGDVSFKCLPYQVSMLVDLTIMLVTGNGESGFDSGEGA